MEVREEDRQWWHPAELSGLSRGASSGGSRAAPLLRERIRARELRTGGPALPAGRRGSRPSGTHEDREEGRLGGGVGEERPAGLPCSA